MNYIDILNSNYFNETYKKIEEIKKDFPVNHGFIHINNVIRNAKRLSKTFNLNKKQEELLLIAATLHDIGYIEGRENHAENGSELAKKYLKDNNFIDKDIEVICNLIKSHSGKKEEDFTCPISMCLIAADKLDFISNRYNKDMLEEVKKDIFPNIKDTYLEYKNNKLSLTILINDLFLKEAFEKEKYFYKLTNFLNTLSHKLNTSYEIIYKI